MLILMNNARHLRIIVLIFVLGEIAVHADVLKADARHHRQVDETKNLIERIRS